LVLRHTVRDERAVTSAGSPDRSRRASATGTMLCRHCEYNPASPRIFGYCSWDCHDADADEDEEPVAA
jgi:hypothetical protein